MAKHGDKEQDKKTAELQRELRSFLEEQTFGGRSSAFSSAPRPTVSASGPDWSKKTIDQSLHQVTVNIPVNEWTKVTGDVDGSGLAYISARQTEIGSVAETLNLRLALANGNLVVVIESKTGLNKSDLDYSDQDSLRRCAIQNTLERLNEYPVAQLMAAQCAANVVVSVISRMAIDDQLGHTLPILLDAAKKFAETYFDTRLQLLGIRDAKAEMTVRPQERPIRNEGANNSGRRYGAPGEGVSHLLQESNVRLDDIGGYGQVKAEIRKLIRLFENPKHFASFGVIPPRGILFIGPPGTGKTTFAKAMCNELGINFYLVSTSDVLNCLYGESEKRLAEIFDNVETPCVVFVDELEALAANRDALSEPSKRVLTELLKKLDGMGSRPDILFLGATNKPEMLDPAITRSGRLDKTIVIGPPDLEARKEILEVYVKHYGQLNNPKLECLKTLDTEKLARCSEGLVGGDLRELMRRVVFAVADSALPDANASTDRSPWEPQTTSVMSLIEQYHAELEQKRSASGIA